MSLMNLCLPKGKIIRLEGKPLKTLRWNRGNCCLSLLLISNYVCKRTNNLRRLGAYNFKRNSLISGGT